MRLRNTFVAALLLTGACQCGDAGLQSGRPVFVLQTTAVDFGAVPEGSSETRAVRIENAGRSVLVVAARIESGSSPDFSTPGTEVEIAAGAIGTVEVGFVPAGSGSDTGVLLVESNDERTPEGARCSSPAGPSLRWWRSRRIRWTSRRRPR